MLLERGAYRLRRDIYGVTPLHRMRGEVDAVECEIKLRQAVSDKILLSKLQRGGVRSAQRVSVHSRCKLKKGGAHVQVILRISSDEWFIFGDDEEVAVEGAVAAVLGIADEEVRAARIGDEEITTTRSDGSDFIVALEREGRVMKGAVRFVGRPTFVEKGDTSLWIGVQLAFPAGDSDGTVDGVHYFSCNPNYGCWVRPFDLQLVTKSVDVVVKKRHGETLAEERVRKAEARRVAKEAKEAAERAAEEVIRQRQAAALKFAAMEAQGGAAVAASLYAALDDDESSSDGDEAREGDGASKEGDDEEGTAGQKAEEEGTKKKKKKKKSRRAASKTGEAKEGDAGERGKAASRPASKEGEGKEGDDDGAVGAERGSDDDESDDETKEDDTKEESETDDADDDEASESAEGEESEDFEAPADGKEDDDDRAERLERKLLHALKKEKKRAEELAVLLDTYWPFERNAAATKIASWFKAKRGLAKFLLSQARKQAATLLQTRVKVWSGRAPGPKYVAAAKIEALYRGLKKRGWYTKAKKKARRKKKAAAAKKKRLKVAKAKKKAAEKEKKMAEKAAKRKEKANAKQVAGKTGKKKASKKKPKAKAAASGAASDAEGRAKTRVGAKKASGAKKKVARKKKKTTTKK
jgi:hypothetical protein